MAAINNRRTTLLVRLYLDGDPYEDFTSCSIEYSGEATIQDARDAIANYLRIENDFVLVDGRTGATLTELSTVGSAQLENGQILELAEMGRRDYVAIPVRDTDSARLIHIAGPQLGFSWPVIPSADTKLTLVGSRLRAAQPGSESLSVSMGQDGRSVVVRHNNDQIQVQVDGRPASETASANFGSIIRISDTHRESTLELRVVSREEHDLSRPVNATVAYRVRPVDPAEYEIRPKQLRLTPPRQDNPPEWDWLDSALLDGSMVIVYLFLALSGSFGLFILPFMALPVARFFLRYRRHRHDVVASQERLHEAVMAFDRELGVLEETVRIEASILARRNPSLQAIAADADVRGGRLWNRRSNRQEFLQIEVGRGVYKTPSTAEIAGNKTDPYLDVWRKDRDNLRLIANTPIELDLLRNDFAIIGPRECRHDYLADLVLRICLLHSPNELTISALLPTDRTESQRLSWVQWLPHASTTTPLFGSHRFPAGPVECRSVMQANIGMLRDGAPGTSHIIVIVHDASGVDVGDLKRYRDSAEGRVHLVWFGSSEAYPDYFATSVTLETTVNNQRVDGLFRPTSHRMRCALTDETTATRIAASIAALVDESGTEASEAIARSVPLSAVVDMSGNALQIGRRSAREALIAGLGETSSGLFEIDLVAQGPHVLVAGTTGSGKSELLKALTLSLAARYSPNELALLLVDFKGGASFHEVAELPHCVGSVSNLDQMEVDRVIRFLQAEIERRQSILAKYQGEYVSYRRSSPKGLPRLVLIIDEFQGFVQDDNARREAAILNVAARGRSLGVHLIIATQSPRGVVTGQVRANVNARICLRVLDSAESEQVLDSPIAASIPRDVKGRAFLRSESGSLVEFQSAWTGSASLTSVSSPPVVIRKAHSISSTSNSHEDQRAEALTTDLSVLVSHIESADEGVVHQPKLGPSLLTSVERISAVDEKHHRTEGLTVGRALLGIRDDPDRQSQSGHTVDLAKGGLLLTGGATSGRTHALAALVHNFMTTHRPCQCVVIDGGGGDLAELVGESASWSIEATDRASVSHLISQLAQNYGSKTLPLLLVIDRIDVLQDVLTDITVLCRTIAGGGRQNIFCAATNDSNLETDAEIRRAFSSRLTFLADHQGILFESERPGALIRVASPTTDPQGSHPVDSSSSGSWQERYPVTRLYNAIGEWRPLTIAKIPESVFPPPLEPNSGLLLGIDQTRRESIFVTVSDGLAVAGEAGSGKSNTLYLLARQWAHITGKRVPILARSEIFRGTWAVNLRSAWNLAHDDAEEYISALERDETVDRIIFVDDIDEIDRQLRSVADLPATYVTVILGALRNRIDAGEWRVVASAPFAAFTSSRLLPIGDDVLSYRNHMVNLQPAPAHLMPIWSGFDMQSRALTTNTTDRDYEVGEGAYINKGRRREVQVLQRKALLSWEGAGSP